jgi:hypothetical protein
LKQPVDPTDEKNFVVGGKKVPFHFGNPHLFFFFFLTFFPSLLSLAQFDVYREDKRKFCWAVVTEVDFSSPLKRICFRFSKTKDNHVEWVEFGSPHICRYKSKVMRKELKLATADSRNATIPTHVSSDPANEASFFVGGKSFFQGHPLNILILSP